MKKFTLACVFAPGFERIIENLIKSKIQNCVNFKISSGFVIFETTENPVDSSKKLSFCNNVFLILKQFNQDESSVLKPDWNSFVNKVVSSKPDQNLQQILCELNLNSFRLRFSASNQFVNVLKNTSIRAENFIQKNSKLKINRTGELNSCEFWFFTRKEGFAAFALRLTQKSSTEKRFNKGELRSEFVELLIALLEIPKNSGEKYIFCDPFAGYGSIPAELLKEFSKSTIYACEINKILASNLARKFSGNHGIRVRECDAKNLFFIKDKSVDFIITDPPWGSFENTDVKNLYKNMLCEFQRILKQNAKALILTSAKTEFESEIAKNVQFCKNLQEENFRTDVLVNGKKAAAYIIKS